MVDAASITASELIVRTSWFTVGLIFTVLTVIACITAHFIGNAEVRLWTVKLIYTAWLSFDAGSKVTTKFHPQWTLTGESSHGYKTQVAAFAVVLLTWVCWYLFSSNWHEVHPFKVPRNIQSDPLVVDVAVFLVSPIEASGFPVGPEYVLLQGC